MDTKETITVDDLRRAQQWLRDNDHREHEPWVLWCWEIKRLWPAADIDAMKDGDVVTLSGQKVLVRSAAPIPTR